MNQTEAIKKAEDRLNLCIHISECSENKGRDKRRSTMIEIERAIAYWEEFEREIDEMPHSEILEAQREPVRTALRILRAELDREKNPPTWNERINQMTVEEKAKHFEPVCVKGIAGADFTTCRFEKDCSECLKEYLASPYTEGETK